MVVAQSEEQLIYCHELNNSKHKRGLQQLQLVLVGC